MKKFNLDGTDYTVPTRAASQAKQGAQTMVKAATPADVLRASGAGAWHSDETPTTPQTGVYRSFGKRAFDTALVLAAAPFALPLIGLCALALRIEGGSAFYTQPRLGFRGKTFQIMKLRTMVEDADAVLESYLEKDPAMRKEWDELQKLRNDPRITPLGKFLRATSIDELPQLFNVLTGDMSLVGPRPMMPEQEKMYGDMTDYNAVRPGITGAWQVSARNENAFSFRKGIDAQYNKTLSFWGDIKVLAKTVGVVCRRTGM